MKKIVMECPKCGSHEFHANQRVSMGVIVDGEGNWIRNVEGGIYDADDPFGPFTCKGCKKSYDNLPIEVEVDPVVELMREAGEGNFLDTRAALDEIVHDVMLQKASNLNNGSLNDTIQFLVQEVGLEKVKDALKKARGQ